jgi:hypothetical protein
LQCKKLKNI